jgi:hypothetical protein
VSAWTEIGSGEWVGRFNGVSMVVSPVFCKHSGKHAGWEFQRVGDDKVFGTTGATMEMTMRLAQQWAKDNPVEARCRPSNSE